MNKDLLLISVLSQKEMAKGDLMHHMFTVQSYQFSVEKDLRKSVQI